jgi:phospholipase/carboxylesterase
MTNTVIKETKDILGSMLLHYLIHEPKIKSGKKKAIILLHGVGSNEKDLFCFANQLPGDFLVIAPRGPLTIGTNRYAWFNVDFSTGKPVYNAEQETSSRKIIEKFVQQIKQKYEIEELFLGGFSQGGIMSYTIGLKNPKEVKGIISLSGRLLVEIRPSIIGNDDLHQLKVFVAHGIQDNTLSIQYARDAKSFLENLHVQLTYHEYDMGHQINEQVIHDMNVWLNEW